MCGGGWSAGAEVLVVVRSFSCSLHLLLGALAPLSFMCSSLVGGMLFGVSGLIITVTVCVITAICTGRRGYRCVLVTHCSPIELNTVVLTNIDLFCVLCFY